MSLRFYPISIKTILHETPDCVSIEFDIPEALQETFRYHAGQNLTIRTQVDGQEVRRSYSLCSSPNENTWKVAVKKVPLGLFSHYANERLRAGDVLELMPPVGNFFTEPDPRRSGQYLAIAAGSGITPVLSMLKSILATEPLSRLTLIYGNRNRSSIIFFEELEALKNRYMDRLSVIHVLSRERTDTEVNTGRIDAQKLGELGPLIDYSGLNACFLCGPEELIFTARDFLLTRGVDRKKVHFELFTAPGQKKGTPEPEDSWLLTGPLSTVTIQLDGRRFDVELSLKSKTSILDAALKQGADLPFACKGGMCCTCKAKLVEGEVSMDVHWGLEEEEVARGYILTCQSHPKTEKIVVDFDIK
jgi:ring-1,2-phenylacetyl-CoA epoxidase subunit PaaE